jgi:hypothetical protein
MFTRLSRVLLIALASALPAVLPAAPATATLDAHDAGPTYDGIGALSAGASSRLLIDYPPQQRAEILDFLFKPKFGAALQINKVEIGGDTNSTDGAEPSHMRTAQDENYQRGYEWWLMEESKKRNPDELLYGLEWGAPHWVNPAKNNVWTPENITYLTKWIQHAATDHHLTIDYLGGWNERSYDAGWYEQLRTRLNAAGLSQVKIVADDSFNWKVGPAAVADPAFAHSFDIVGMHYPHNPIGDPQSQPYKDWLATCTLNRPLWGSEIGWQGYDGGAANLAQIYNDDHIDLGLTAFINWSTIWAVLPGLPYDGSGLMLADEPWSGHYAIGRSLWVTAHTTQFTAPGWHYLKSACHHFDDANHKSGSFVALCSPDGAHFSVIVQTVRAMKPQALDLTLAGTLASPLLHVWKTDLRSKNDADWFIRQPDVPTRDGSVSLTFDPGCVYTVTNTTGQAKGVTSPPPSAPFPFPFHDDFDAGQIGATPPWFSDQQGAFEIASAAGGRTGHCLRQVVTEQPISWNSEADPATMVGSLAWTDYTVHTDAFLEQAGYVEIVGHIPASNLENHICGYHFRLDDTGRYSLYLRQNDKRGTEKPLANGVLPPTASLVGQWHQLTLTFKGTTVSAAIDGTTVVPPVTDTTFPAGMIALVTSRWIHADFAHVTVTP